MKRFVLLATAIILSGSLTAYAKFDFGIGDRPQQGSGGKSNVTVVGGDAESLSSVIEFLVEEYGPISADIETTVYVSEIADDFAPFELILPDDAEVIGTVQYTNLPDEKGFRPNRLFITTTLTPVEVIDFFEESLGDEFTIPENNYAGPSGLIDPNSPVNGMFCYDGDEAILTLTAYGEDGLTHLEINVVTEMYDGGLCSTASGMPPYEGGAFDIMPELKNPEDARVRLSGGGGNPQRAESSASIWLEGITAGDLLDVYAPQVEDDGWTITASSSDDLGSWLLATFEDEDGDVWSAQLTVMADPANGSAFNASLLVYR